MARPKKMRCHKCKKIIEEAWSLTEYGERYYSVRDDNDYCEKCFIKLIGEDNEKSNNKE